MGYQAGEDVTGSSNVIIGHNTAEGETAISNQLWIDNSTTTTPLIYGDFNADYVTIYDYLGVGDASPSYNFTVDGTASISDDFYVGDDLFFVDVSANEIFSSASWDISGD